MIDFDLMQHQKDVIYRSQFEPHLFLAWEMGTGKTCAIIQILRQLYGNHGALRKTLILAPKVVLDNWKDEFKKFSKIPPDYIHVLKGPVKKRAEYFASMDAFSSIAITNYDALQSQELTDAIIKWGPDILICDESHFLKNYQSKRAKNVAKISDVSRHKYLLTGTPILNNAMDLFMQYRVLDGGKTFGHNFFVYRSRYFYDTNAGWKGSKNHFPNWQPREGSQHKLMALMADNTLRVEKEDCMDLPPLIVQDAKVELGLEQRKHYNEMKKYFMTYIKGEVSVAQLAITKALRLQQIVSGFVKTDEGKIHRIKKNPRLDALKEYLEILTPNHKVIVWACFKENYKMIGEICDKIGIRYAELHGSVNEKDRREAIRSFNNDAGMRVLIANQGAGGIGINLVSATYSIYYSRGFKLGDDLQSAARNYRRGSEIHAKITRINLVANETIDGLIADALKLKIDLSNSFLDYIKRNGSKYGL